MNENTKFIDTLKIGNILSFRIKSKLFKVRGEIKDIYYDRDQIYLNIYFLFYRKEKTYRINKNSELVEIKENDFEDNYNNNSIIYYDLKDDQYRQKKYSYLKRFIYFSILIIFVFSITPDIKLPEIFNHYSYSDFLKEEHSLNSLFQIVKSRVRYVYDVGDQWNTPLYAWNEKGGDCEEFAGICSDYLTHHDIENYLVGLNLLRNREGHAVVFVKMQESFYIIDPTYAAESAGLKKLKVSTLREAVKLYSTFPAAIYKVPVTNGEKEVIDYIY